MKLTIYYGKEKPLIAIGKHQVNLLSFAEKYKGWHSYGNDKKSINAINGLLKRGSIIVNEHNQFMINY